MELSNCFVALAGDRGNTVPKYGVTPAEIAVLMEIHGEDAVFEIALSGDQTERTNAAEKERLLRLYPARNRKNDFIVDQVYPGRSPVMPKALSDLGLDETLLATVERAAAPKKSGKTAKPKKEEAASEPDVAVGDQAPENDATSLFGDDE